jgi:hypothetical protein
LAITEKITRTYAALSTSEVGTNDQWIDAEDLEELYKNKPQQLANIKNNAKRLECQVRGTTLFAVPTYISKKMDMQHESLQHGMTVGLNSGGSTQGQKRSLTDEQRVAKDEAAQAKRAKMQHDKAERAAAKEAAKQAAREARPVSEPFLKKTKKWLQILEERLSAWAALKIQHPDLETMPAMPKLLVDKMALNVPLLTYRKSDSDHLPGCRSGRGELCGQFWGVMSLCLKLCTHGSLRFVQGMWCGCQTQCALPK